MLIAACGCIFLRRCALCPCATNKLAYATMQPSSSPQTHPSTKPMLINHFIIAFTVRREASASIDVFVLVDVERRPTRIVMWCVFSRARRRIQLHRFRDRCSIKACIQAESFAVDSGVAADRAWCWYAQNILCTRYVAHYSHQTGSKCGHCNLRNGISREEGECRRMLIVVRAIISSCFGCSTGRRNGWLERRWILAWSGGSWIFNYTRLLNCKWLMWRIGHGNRIRSIPTFTYFASVTVRGPVL